MRCAGCSHHGRLYGTFGWCRSCWHRIKTGA